MEIVAHRINSIAGLKLLPKDLGAEIDIRSSGSVLYLNHEPFGSGDSLEDYLDEYGHGLLVLNIKEAGIEADVLRAVRARGIGRHFLLDVELPYVLSASRAGERAIAIRYSEEESIDFARRYAGKVDWVWIDTITTLPIEPNAVEVLKSFQSCLVCPERWGRPEDIESYRRQLAVYNFEPNAVMTGLSYAPRWRAS